LNPACAEPNSIGGANDGVEVADKEESRGTRGDITFKIQ